MTRTKKLLILLAVFLVVVCGGIAAAKFITSDKVTETKGAYSAVSFDPETVTAFSWSNAGGEEFTLLREDGAFVLQSDRDFPIDQKAVSDWLASMSDMRADVMIEGAGKLSDYGLEPARLTITVSFSDGKSDTYLCGDFNKLISSAYIMKSGSGVVYASPTDLTGIVTDIYAIMVWDELPAGSDRYFVSIDRPDGTHFSATYVEDPASIYYSDGYKWFVTETLGTPAPQPLNYMDVATLCRNLSNVKLASCLYYYSTDAMLAEYGLDDPIVFRMKTRDEVTLPDGTKQMTPLADYTLRLGKSFEATDTKGNNGTYYYAMVGDSPAIYAIASGRVKDYIDSTGAECYPTQLLKLSLDDVSHVAIEYASGRIDYDISVERIERPVTGNDGKGNETVETDVSTELTVMRGEDRLASRSFESIFNSFASIGVEKRLTENDTQDRETVYTLIIDTPKAAITQVRVTLCEYSGNYYLANVMGDRTVLVSASAADDILRSFKNVPLH